LIIANFLDKITVLKQVQLGATLGAWAKKPKEGVK
jgi:hypothetical protein